MKIKRKMFMHEPAGRLTRGASRLMPRKFSSFPNLNTLALVFHLDLLLHNSESFNPYSFLNLKYFFVLRKLGSFECVVFQQNCVSGVISVRIERR
jgi:hypothetical protein